MTQAKGPDDTPLVTPQFWDSLREDEDNNARNITTVIGIDVVNITMIYVVIFHLAAAIAAAVPDQASHEQTPSRRIFTQYSALIRTTYLWLCWISVRDWV